MSTAAGLIGMTLEKDVLCPSCGETRSFYRTAAMTLHLGEKTKWRCPACGYGFVEIDGIDTLPA
jgi:rubredoxin